MNSQFVKVRLILVPSMLPVLMTFAPLISTKSSSARVSKLTLPSVKNPLVCLATGGKSSLNAVSVKTKSVWITKLKKMNMLIDLHENSDYSLPVSS